MATGADGGSLVLHGRVLTDGHELDEARVETARGRIVAVTPRGHAGGADVAVEGWIVPGLIDLQINGAYGADFTAADGPDRAVAAVARALVRHGVTGFCPTVVSSPPEVILERLRAYQPRDHAGGAGSLGPHVEGPFLGPHQRGAHTRSSLRSPDLQEVERWLSAGAPSIVTLAPELPDALDAIRRLVAAGTVVSLGHSAANVVQARSALSAGATMGTHLLNGMPIMHHRRPGLAGALLLSTATLGLICDGVHVHPLVAELVVRIAGVGRVALVSDAAATAGLTNGEAARLPDGTLAGGGLLLDGCLRNVRRWFQWLTPAQILLMATATPARALGAAVASRKGRVAPGYDADLTVLDADWQVAMTIVGGRVVFQRSRSERVAVAGGDGPVP